MANDKRLDRGSVDTNNRCIMPHCDGGVTVLDTRLRQNGTRTRRYGCVVCKGRFTTVECLPGEYQRLARKAANWDQIADMVLQIELQVEN